MTKKSVWQSIGFILIVAALIFGLSFFSNDTKRDSDSAEVKQTETQETISVTVNIEGLYNNKPIDVLGGQTVLQLLESQNNNDSQLKLRTKEYSGLGTLVEAMGSMNNGDQNQYWQYKVNGVMPQVGADQYKLSDGDMVEWYFEKSTY